LLVRLMRERLREHSRHLEAQHRQAVGDSDGGDEDASRTDDEDDDDDARSAGDSSGETQGDAAPLEASEEEEEASTLNVALRLKDEKLNDERRLVSERRRGSDASNPTNATKGMIKPLSTKPPNTPEGQRLVDLVRADVEKKSRVSPSQRRVRALLKMERVVGTEARGDGAAISRRAASPRDSRSPAPASFAKPNAPDAFRATRNGFLNFAGSFFGRTPGKTGKTDAVADAGKASETAPAPFARVRLSARDSRALFDRLYSEKKKAVARDAEETFAPKISEKTRRLAADVHARENGGLPRVEYLLRKGTETIRERAALTAPMERGERRRANANARTIDPSFFFLDPVRDGPPRNPGDAYVRAVRALRDAELAEDRKVCTFHPKITDASRVIAEERDRVDPSSARRGPLGMYARGLEFLERRKRAAVVAEAKRLANEEEECTFRPISAKSVPSFVRRIAAKMRSGRAESPLDESSLLGSFSGALLSATRKPAGWLASPTFSISNWTESLGVKSGETRDGEKDGTPTTAAAAAALPSLPSLPSVPVDHPARRRAGAHVPLHSASSHYRFKSSGGDFEETSEFRATSRRAANLEALFRDVADSRASRAFPELSRAGTHERVGSKSRDARQETRRGADGTTTHAEEADYFERTHLERRRRARAEALEKAKRLTRYDGSGWTNRVTEPEAPALGRKPDMSRVRSLRRPLVARVEACSGGVSGGHALSNAVGDGRMTAREGLRGERREDIDLRGEASAGAPSSPRGGRGGQHRGSRDVLPPSSPLATRLRSGSAGYYRDVDRRAKEAPPATSSFGFRGGNGFGGFAVAGSSSLYGRSARETSSSSRRGPPGWSEREYSRSSLSEDEDGAEALRGGGARSFERRDAYESDHKDYHDDFGEFKSEGEYDSEFD